VDSGGRGEDEKAEDGAESKGPRNINQRTTDKSMKTQGAEERKDEWSRESTEQHEKPPEQGKEKQHERFEGKSEWNTQDEKKRIHELQENAEKQKNDIKNEWGLRNIGNLDIIVTGQPKQR